MDGRRRIPGLGDLGAQVNPIRLLAELAADLRSIRKHTISMDREVTGMHASVEPLSSQVWPHPLQVSWLAFGKMAARCRAPWTRW